MNNGKRFGHLNYLFKKKIQIIKLNDFIRNCSFPFLLICMMQDKLENSFIVHKKEAHLIQFDKPKWQLRNAFF